MVRNRLMAAVVATIAGIAALTGIAARSARGTCSTKHSRPAGTPTRFHHADEDYFHDMDGGSALKLSPQEIIGRNMWLVWTGGNDRFWDRMTNLTFGAFDLLKIVAYDPRKPIDRAQRWT